MMESLIRSSRMIDNIMIYLLVYVLLYSDLMEYIEVIYYDIQYTILHLP